MQKIMLTLVLAAASSALAGNYTQLNATTRTLAGALQGEFDNGVSGIRSYLPGYGYQISMYNALGNDDPKSAATRITTILKQLAPTVQGLDKAEWLSVSFKGKDAKLNDFELLVRWRAGKIERLLNGKAY